MNDLYFRDLNKKAQDDILNELERLGKHKLVKELKASEYSTDYIVGQFYDLKDIEKV